MPGPPSPLSALAPEFAVLALWLAHALAAEPMLLDAGSLVSPLMPGFDRLHLEGSDDPRAVWRRPPTRAQVGRDPDPLALDDITAGVLHLDLEPGSWTLHAMLGTAAEDPKRWAGIEAFGLRVSGSDGVRVDLPRAWPDVLASPAIIANPRPVFRPDETPWDRQIAPASPWQVTSVEVGRDGIDVEAFGRPLQGLMAWPADRAVEQEVMAVVHDDLREAWWQRHVVGESVAQRAAPRVSAGALGVHTSAVDDPDLRPIHDEVLHLGRGDRVTRLLVVRGVDGPGTVTVDAPDGVDVDVGEAWWLDAAGHPHRALRPRPTVIEPGPAWQGQQGTPPVLVVTLRTHEHTQPVDASVRIRLQSAGQSVVQTLPVQVHDVLVDASVHAGLFMQVPPIATLRTGFASDTVLALVREQLDLFADHGLDTVSLRYAFWPDQDVAGEGNTAVFDAVVDHWAARDGHALVWADPKVPLRNPAYNQPDGPVLPRHLEARTAVLVEHAAQAPLPVWLHVWEEEAGWKHLDVVHRGRALSARLRHLTSSTPLLLGALATPADWAVADAMDVAMVTGRPDVLRQGVAHVRRQGASPWAYNLGPGATGPMTAWATGAKGLLQWHANPRASDPFHAVHAKVRWFHTVLATDGHPRATVLLADLADGVADARLWAQAERDQEDMSAAARRATLSILQTTRTAWSTAEPSLAHDGVVLSATTRMGFRARLLGALATVPK